MKYVVQLLKHFDPSKFGFASQFSYWFVIPIRDSNYQKKIWRFFLGTLTYFCRLSQAKVDIMGTLLLSNATKEVVIQQL